MRHYVKVTDCDDAEAEKCDTVEIATEDDGTLSEVNVTSQFPGGSGLRYRIGDVVRAVTFSDGKFYPPENGWTDRTYRCVFPKMKRSDQPESSVEESFHKRPRIELPQGFVFNRFVGIMEKNYFIDKSRIIETIISQMFGQITDTSICGPEKLNLIDPILLTAPRRFGKTTNLQLIGAFLSGSLSKDKVQLLDISKSEAMNWYGKFAVIYVTFGLSDGEISSVNDAIDACRSIVHQAFKDYAYLVPFLDEGRSESFKEWCHEDKHKDKDKNDVAVGLNFLVECMLIRYGYKKKCILLIDEFDRLSSKALFSVPGDVLNQVINVYSDMVGSAVKHSAVSTNCYGIFTGVTALTSKTMSSLNNMKIISVLSDEKYARFYGFTMEEFKEILSRSTISAKTKALENRAVSYYNGYQCGGISILNTYSVKEFIENEDVKVFWKESGVVVGLSYALRFRSWRKIISKLIIGDFVSMKLMTKINVTEFDNFSNESYDMVNYNTTLNLIHQQGYLSIAEHKPDEVLVKVPNEEIKSELRRQVELSFERVFNFDQDKIRACCDCFKNINISYEPSCKAQLKNLKLMINEMLGSKKKDQLNEAWFEAFLYHVFMEYFDFGTQNKIPTTAIKNDIRAKIYDLFIRKCIVFEESFTDSAENTLKKMIEKKCVISAEKAGLPFLLVAFSVQEDSRGFVDVHIGFVRNSILGEKIFV